MLLVQDLKAASVEKLESWLQDAKQNNVAAVNRLEYYLLNKYCAVGVSVSAI